MQQQNARDPPGQPRGEPVLADNQSGDVNVELESTIKFSDSPLSPWYGVGELSFRVPTLGVATASPTPRTQHDAVQQQSYNFPGITPELHERETTEQKQLTDVEGGANCRGLAGDGSTQAPEAPMTLTNPAAQSVGPTSFGQSITSYSSENGTVAAAKEPHPQTMLPPLPLSPKSQASPAPRAPGALPADCATTPATVAATVTATATTAVATNSNRTESNAQQQPQLHGVPPSVLIAVTAAARAGGLRRRSGTSTPPLQQPWQSTLHRQRNRNRVSESHCAPLPDLKDGQQQPILLHTRTAAELSIPSTNGGGGSTSVDAAAAVARVSAGGGGAVWTSAGRGGALDEVEEQQRISWGLHDDSRGGANGSNGGHSVPYDADQAQRMSWALYCPGELLYGGCRSGTHRGICGGGAATVASIGAVAIDSCSSTGGAGSGAGDMQLPSPRSAFPGSSPALLSSPAPSPVATSPRMHSVVARQRWHRALAAVGEVHLLHRRARTLADKESAPADRLFAALSLALQRRAWDKLLADNPHRLLLRHYVEKKRAGQCSSLWERLEAEFMITGTIVFDWCTPARMGEHWPLFTTSFLAVAALLFAFMAGLYPHFAVLEAEAAKGCRALAEAERSDLAAKCGPRFLMDVLLHPGSLPATTFSGAFLRAWGGLYPPDLQRGQAYRWLTAQLLHTSFRHAAANLALTAALGWQMEVKYGTVRVMVVWLAAVVGGELLSTAVEDPCRQVVGCSGGAFGLLGLFCADTLLHLPRLRQPILRCATIGVLLGFMVYTLAVQQGNVSSMAHVGGLLCGLLPSLLVLPRLGSERWEAAWPALGLSAVMIWFSVLPAWVYTRRLPMAAVSCA